MRHPTYFTSDPVLRALTARAKAAGYTVRFADYCEDASTPGFLGQMGGKCDHTRREITVSVRLGRGYRSRKMLWAILEHECRHAEGQEHAGDVPELGLFCGGTVSIFVKKQTGEIL